jgi:adenine-specific DNA-methyltransferase
VFYRDGRGATRELEQILGSNLMDFPKSVDVLRDFVALVADEDSVVLDFFAGSCPLAQAVLELNRLDHGNRNFIVVQLPERTGDGQYPTIAEIGKARIRHIIEKLRREEQDLAFESGGASEDLGFKVFKLAPPNIQRWAASEERDVEAYAQKLAMFNDPLIAGWKPENVIWEVAVREGFSLNTHYTARELSNGNNVYDVTDADTGQKFTICLDEKILSDISKSCELGAEDLFVCRDVALDDSAAANLALQCRLKTI